MWSRRAQEYEAKINSGDIVAIAEVVRDLFRSESQPEQSYSERQLYEAALDRLSREIAAVQHVTETEAVKEIEAALAKGPRRGPKPAERSRSRRGSRRGGSGVSRPHIRNTKGPVERPGLLLLCCGLPLRGEASVRGMRSMRTGARPDRLPGGGNKNERHQQPADVRRPASRHPPAEAHAPAEIRRLSLPRVRAAREISLGREPPLHAAAGVSGKLSRHAACHRLRARRHGADRPLRQRQPLHPRFHQGASRKRCAASR